MNNEDKKDFVGLMDADDERRIVENFCFGEHGFIFTQGKRTDKSF